MFVIESIDHVALAVRDVRRSAAWYQEVLGLERLHEEVWGDVPAIVGTGGTAIALEFQDHGIAHSIYFFDPDGHALEITTYDLGAEK